MPDINVNWSTSVIFFNSTLWHLDLNPFRKTSGGIISTIMLKCQSQFRDFSLVKYLAKCLRGWCSPDCYHVEGILLCNKKEYSWSIIGTSTSHSTCDEEVIFGIQIFLKPFISARSFLQVWHYKKIYALPNFELSNVITEWGQRLPFWKSLKNP